MIITDGEGKGYSAGITSENRLKTSAITATIEHHVNHLDKQAYQLVFQVTPEELNPSIGTGEACFLYIKNSSETDICLEGIFLRLGGTAQTESIKINPLRT